MGRKDRLSPSEKVLHGWKETLGPSGGGIPHNTEQMAVVTAACETRHPCHLLVGPYGRHRLTRRDGRRRPWILGG